MQAFTFKIWLMDEPIFGIPVSFEVKLRKCSRSIFKEVVTGCWCSYKFACPLYTFVRHVLISQCWLNGLVRFCLSLSQHWEGEHLTPSKAAYLVLHVLLGLLHSLSNEPRAAVNVANS